MLDVVEFKSTPENWEKEKSGVKPNTVRVLQAGDPRDAALSTKSAKKVRIINTASGCTFERTITDATFWDGRWIISWRHRHDEAKAGHFGINKNGVLCAGCSMVCQSFLSFPDWRRCLSCTRRVLEYELAIARRELDFHKANVQRWEKLMEDLEMAEKIEKIC